MQPSKTDVVPRSAAFPRLLSPLTPATFFSEYYEQKPVHLKGDGKRFTDLLSEAKLWDLLHDEGDARSAPEGFSVKVAFHDDRGEHDEVEELHPNDAHALVRGGMTLCVASLHLIAPEIERFRRQLQSELRSWGELGVNCYLSPEGQGFGTHFDDHSVWICQVEGSKRWRYSATPAVTWPVVNVILPASGSPDPETGDTLARPDESAFVESVIEAGDVLYLPAGTWHQAAAVGRSLGLTVRAPRVTFARLLTRAMGMDDVGKSFDLRRHLPLLQVDDALRGLDSLQKDAERALALLKERVNALKIEDVMEAWAKAAAPRDARKR
jgi:ribosomal protein L16 Arg81 hydroxylase